MPFTPGFSLRKQPYLSNKMADKHCTQARPSMDSCHLPGLALALAEREGTTMGGSLQRGVCFAMFKHNGRFVPSWEVKITLYFHKKSTALPTALPGIGSFELLTTWW